MTPKSKRLESTWPGKGVRLSDEQVDALIDQLKEIAKANVDLIDAAEAAQADSVLVRERASRLQLVVSVAFAIGCVVAGAMYLHIRSATAEMRTNVEQATEAFKALDKNVALTLEVVRALSEAQAAKVVADVDMNPKSEAEALDKASEAQRKAIEAETKIQKDPAKKAQAEDKLRDLDDADNLTK